VSFTSSWRHHHRASPIRCDLQVKTSIGSPGRTTAGLGLYTLLGGIIFNTNWSLLLVKIPPLCSGIVA
jgi:hypothetical protein